MTNNRNFQNKIRDDWREDQLKGDNILPRDYTDKLHDRSKAKTMHKSNSQDMLDRCKFYFKIMI